jgi:ribosome-interacting GTPase 1
MTSQSDAHDRLIEAIDYELDHYGAASLADVIATVLDARHDEHSRAAHRMFQELAIRLNQLPRPEAKR